MNNQSKHQITRRELLKLIKIGSGGLILSACAPEVTEMAPTPETAEDVPGGPTGPAYDQGELKILLCCYTDETLGLQTRYNADFEATYPGVTVNQEQTPAGQNYFEKLQTLIAAGTPPDVFDMWEGYVGPYAANGVLQDLTPYIDVDPEWKMDDFQPAAVAASSWRGRLYALVRDFYPGPSLFYYNTDLFDKASLEYPNADWSWDDMRAAGKALSMDTAGSGAINQWGLAYETWFVPWLHWIWSNGGDIFNADETKSTLTDPKTVEALQYWADLAIEDKAAMPSAELSAMQGAPNAFKTGTIGMYLGYTWNIAEMTAAREEGLNWSTCLPPKANSGGRVFYMHLECWASAKETKVPKTAWRYIRDYQEKAVAEFVTYYPGIPLLKDKIDLFLTPEHIAYGWDKIPDIIADPKNIRIPGSGAKWDKISGLIQAELDLVFIGEKSAKEAAETAAPLVDEELARSSAYSESNCFCTY